MSLWNQVDFTGADETINFGCAQKQELKTLYDIHTVSNICPSDRDQDGLSRSNPGTVRSAISNCRVVVVAIKRSVIVYSDLCHDLESIANFDSDVECLCLSEDGDFVIVGCSDGFLRVLFVPLNRCLFSQRLSEKNDDRSRTFSNVTFTPIDKSNGSVSILVFTGSGSVFQFKNILLSDLRNAVNENNDVKTQEILLEVEKFKVNINCNDGFLFTTFGKESFLMTIGDQIDLLTMPELDLMNSLYKESLSGRSLIKAKVMSNCRYAFLLDDSNTLHIMCMMSFLIVKKWNQFKVLDFTLIETVDYESCVCLDTKLAVVVDDIHLDRRCSFLRLYDFPSFELLFSTNAAPFIHLVDVPVNQDIILFLEGVVDDYDTERHISSLAVKEISEAMPEARLSRLLNKRKFDDALNFAKKFNLDQEVVYRTKVNYLFEQLPLQYEHSTFTKEIANIKKELVNCLDKISDIDTVANCCINASLPTLSDTFEMLVYARYKINICKTANENLKSLISDRLTKLETFDSLFGSEQFRTTWKTFNETDLLTELLKFLSQGKMNLVSILWSRHQRDLLQSITKEHVVTVLNSITVSIHSSVFHKWLKISFLPVVLQEIPESLESVISWVINQCTIMEIVDRKMWPRNAIQFAEDLDCICREICSKTTLSSLDLQSELAQLMANEVTKKNAVTNQMRCLLDNLKALAYLRTTYDCRISLADYSLDDKKEVCCCLLTWIDDPNHIEKFVTEFLQPFAQQHGLNIDRVLHDYVQEVIEHKEFDWWHWEEGPWVKQIISVIGCIQDIELLLKSVVVTLNFAPVPWSSQIEELANSCLDLEQPMVSEVKTEMERVVLKVVLMKYGLQKFDIHDLISALTMISHIVVQDKENAMDDALTVVKFFPRIKVVDVYTCRLRYLIIAEKFETLVTTVKGLQLQVAIPCCERLVICTEQMLESKLTTNRESFLFVKAAIFALEHLKKHLNAYEFEDYEELFDKLRRLLALQVEFGIFLTLCDLNSSEKCQAMLRQNTESLLTNGRFLCYLDESDVILLKLNERKVGGISNTYSRLYRLAVLLSVKRRTATEIVSKLAFELNHNDVLLDTLQDVCLEDMDKDFADTLLSLVFYFMEQLRAKVDSMLPSFLNQFAIVLSEMLSSAAIYCDSNILEMCAELSHFVYVLRNVRYHCSQPDLELAEGTMLESVDPFKQWVFSPIYKENVLQVDAKVVLSSVSCIVKELSTDLFEAKSEPKMLAMMSTVICNGQDLIQHLCQKGHISMAYHILIGVIVMFLRHGLKPENSAMMDKVTDIQRKLGNNMITVAFGQRRLDKSMLLSLLLSLQCEEALKILYILQKRCGFDYYKLKVLTEVGGDFARLCAVVPDAVLHFRVLAFEADWGQRLTKLRINYKDAFLASAKEKMKVVSEMCHHPQMTVSFLKEYCEAFALDNDHTFCVMLQSLLTTVIGGEEKSLVQTSTKLQTNASSTSRLFSLCSEAMNEVQSEQLLLNTLQSILEKVDSYNYEALLFVLENIRLKSYSLGDFEAITFSEKGIAVLNFLKHYKRVGKPCDIEKDLWFERNAQSRNIEECVGKRLPFHALLSSDAWKVVSSELTATTIDVWLKVAPVIVGTNTREEEITELKDKIIVIAVQNLIPQATRRLKTYRTNNYDESCSDRAVTNLIDLLSRITDPAKASATASYIISRLPPSYMKVFAARNAIHLARTWFEQTQDKKAERAVEVFENLHTKLSSEYVLRAHGLDKPCYMSLCNDPYKLIVELYKDESIVEGYWFHSAKYPDIHGACKDIAMKNDCDIDEIFFSLLEKWLAPMECAAVGLDDTISMDFNSPKVINVSLENSFNIDDNNLKRAIYLMKLGTERENTSHVAKWIFSDTSGVSHGLKFRAALCLLHTASVDVIEECTKMTINQVLNLAKLLFCSSQLENLHLPCESITFRNQKEVKDMVVQLLQASRYNPKAIELAAQLSLKAKITVPKVWSIILQQMMDTKMCETLSKTLVSLPRDASIAWLPVVSKAWNYVLCASVSNVNANIDKFVLFHSCPSFQQMDLVSLCETFRQMNLLVLALDCLIHIIDPMTRERHITNFFSTSIVTPLLIQLKELKELYYDMYHLDKIVAVVIKKISASETIRKTLNSDQIDWIANNTQDIGM